MKILSSYLNILQEQDKDYSPSIEISNAQDLYEELWTKCYSKKCKKEDNDCKADCKIEAANETIKKLNLLNHNCSKAKIPIDCSEIINQAIESMRDRMKCANEAKNRISGKRAETERMASGV